MRTPRSGLKLVLGLLCMLAGPWSAAQQDTARAVLERAAEALGGLERLRSLDNFVMTGFGQRYSFNGNLSPDPNAPPKWQSVVDASRSYDLRNMRGLNRERNSFQYPLAASFGHSWTPGSTLLRGAELLDHPVPALLVALDAGTALGSVSSEDGLSVVQFTPAGGETSWLALDPLTHRPYWLRRIGGDGTLGDVVYTTWFTGYVPYEGIELPLGLMTKIDWREQPVLMFQVDSYRLNVDELPPFPERDAGSGMAGEPEVVVTPLADGVWDLRIPGRPGTRGGDGGAAVEFDDHLLLFEAYGSEAAVLARIDAANQLVPGKEVTQIVVTHHHSDHAAGVRAAASRGLTIIAERENGPLFREWIGRSAVNFPDALARDPRPLRFLPVDDELVLEDETRRLELYQVVGHSHMGNAVFAYLPAEKLLLEGDLSDVNWEWHWWANALLANIGHYGLDPERNVPVHGEVLGIDETVSHIQRQAEAAMAFCAERADEGYRFFGCPVRYSAYGPVAELE